MSTVLLYRASEPIPDTQAYVFALSQPFVKPYHRAMLAAHSMARNLTITATDLAIAAGYADWRSANRLYGALGHRVADLLDMRPARYSKGPLWTTALAEGWEGDESSGGRWFWRLYPEIAAALQQLGFVPEDKKGKKE